MAVQLEMVMARTGFKIKGWQGVVLRVFFVWPFVLYLSLLLMIHFFKESLTYPGVSMYQHLTLESAVFTEAVAERELELWQTGAGEYLGLKRTVENPEMRWVVFYGNGDVGLRASGWFETLQQHMGERRCDYYVMDYPGYGPQAGTIGEQAIVDLARKAAATIPDDGLPLYFFGQSMGAGVACRLVSEPEWEGQVKGLFIVNPYTSLIGASRQYLKSLTGPLHRLFPVEKLQPDRYESVKNISAFQGRVGIIAGELDTLTPAWMAQELSQQVPGEVKLWIQPGVGHWTDPEPKAKWREMMEFLINPTKP